MGSRPAYSFLRARNWRLAIFTIALAAALAILLISSPAGRSSNDPRLSAASPNTASHGLANWKRLLAPAAYSNDPLFNLTARKQNQLHLRLSDDPSEPIRESDLLEHETYWATRLTYPTGQFSPEWVRDAISEDRFIQRSVPAGARARTSSNSPETLNPNAFTALGPSPEQMTGCAGCFDYGVTAGRVNAIAIDPTTTSNGSIVAYIAAVGGGVWKTTNCCSGSTNWTSITDDPLVSTSNVDTIVIDPGNHNTIYVGTGDLNYGSFSMGSQGILKSTNGGASWSVLGANVFGAAYPLAAGQFPQYQAVGKVRVDPNNSNNVVAGTKTGLYLSYDGGTNWTGPCLTNSFNTQRQDITGLELNNIGGTTRILAAVGTRGFATTVQFDLGNNGANGLYKGTIPGSGCPSDFTLISSNANGFVFGATVTGSPYTTGGAMNAGTGTPYGGSPTTGNQLGRMDIAVAPSNPNYIYAQVGSIAANNNGGCGNTSGCQLGVWSSIDGGATWTFMTGSAGGSLRNCVGTNTGGNPGDYPQNWYDQGMVVDPNDPDRLFIDTYDTWLATRTGTSFYNLTCGYNGSTLANHVVHVDHHALAFVPGSSSILLEGSDGGIFGSTDANSAASGTTRNTWFNMDTGLNTIEFYSGDISGNFNTSATPQAVGGAQDNGPSSVTFAGSPTGPAQWQLGLGGDGFFARIDPVGTGSSLRFFEGNNSGGLSRCTANCTNAGATWVSIRPAWTGDTQSFILPWDIFHAGIAGGDDCGPATASTGCGHLIAGTTRVWETISGTNTSGVSSTWYVTNNPATQNMTKQTLGNRSFINQIKYSPKFQSVAMLGTNDGNVWIGLNLGTGFANQATWVDVTGGNTVLPNRPVLNIALDPSVAAANVPVGYAAVGGFDQNTPTTPGHVFRVSCGASCGSFTWEDKSGNLPNIPVDSVIVNPNVPAQVFAGTDIGLYYTNNIQAASPVWSRFNDGLPNVMIWDMQIDRGSTTLSLWTRGRGAFVWPLPTTPAVTYAFISGAITKSDGQPLAGVTMKLSGANTAKVITDAQGNYRFNNVPIDNVYTVTPSLTNFNFAPASISFTLLANKTDAIFVGTLDAMPVGNAIDTPEYFVRQHYLDFLGREPDESGFNFWSNQILECGADSSCRERRTINVSAAYFLSIEFLETGGFVDGLYRTSYGRRPLCAEFMPDARTVALGVIVGTDNWMQQLIANKQAFLEAWVQRPAFHSTYDGLNNDQYVDTLIGHTGVNFTANERNALVTSLSNQTTTRAEVLRTVAENTQFVNAKRNGMFVMMEYFGYLRRDPDESGYQFWLNKLNQFGGNFEQAEMVKSFIVSGEYRDRFLP